MVSRLSRSLSVLVAVFFFSSPLGYKYQAETRKEQPGDWVVPTNDNRPHCLVIFEIGLPGVLCVLTEVSSYHRIVIDGRGVPLL